MTSSATVGSGGRMHNHWSNKRGLFAQPALSFCWFRIRCCTHSSVRGLGLSLLLRIGWTYLIIAVLEDNHLYPLTAEFFCFCLAGHIDVDVVAVHLPTSVFHGIVAGISASAVNADAAIQRQYPPVGGHGAWMRPLAGSACAFHRICSGDEVTDSGPARYLRGRRRRQSRRQESKNNHSSVQYSQNGVPPRRPR